MVSELNHASLFGDATYKINLSRQTKLRRLQNLPVDEDVAKVRAYTVKTKESITLSHDHSVSQISRSSDIRAVHPTNVLPIGGFALEATHNFRVLRLSFYFSISNVYFSCTS